MSFTYLKVSQTLSIKEFPLINFKNVFKNIFSSAVDPDCRNTCFKLVHSVLYVNKYLYDKNN